MSVWQVGGADSARDLRLGAAVRIEADWELPFGGDGELIGMLPVTGRVRPGALRLLAD